MPSVADFPWGLVAALTASALIGLVGVVFLHRMPPETDDINERN